MQASHWRSAVPAVGALSRGLVSTLPRYTLKAATHGAAGPQLTPQDRRDSPTNINAGAQDPQAHQQPLQRRVTFPRRSSRLSHLSQPLRGRHLGQQLAPGTFFRFWHDEKRFKGTGETSLVQRALLAAGGMRTGGNVKAAQLSGPMGWQKVADWDILWSPSTTALKAADFIQPGQLISTVPGLFAITKKKRMPATLHAAYGEDAWDIIPPTYSIPSQLQQWRAVLKAEALQQREMALQQLQQRKQSHRQQEQAQQQQEQETAAGSHQVSLQAAGESLDVQMQSSSAQERSGAEASTSGRDELPSANGGGLWILKTAQHLGKGLKVVQTRGALKELVERNKHFLRLPPGSRAALSAQQAQDADGSMDGLEAAPSAKPAHTPDRPYVAAQRYITNPLLIQGRKFGIRVWLLVLGPGPLRAYMHCNGLVLFSSEAYQPAAWAAEDGGVAPGHVTNYAQNVDGMVWPVDQLRQHLGQQQYEQLWQRMERASALTIAAAVASVKESAAKLGSPAESAFELLGLDFLVDTNLQPFLLEINATPSLAVEHSDAQTAAVIHQQKNGMVLDMLSLLRLRQRFGSSASSAGSTAAATAAAGAGGNKGSADSPSLSQDSMQRQAQTVTQAGVPTAAEISDRAAARYYVTTTVADGSDDLQATLQQQPQLLERLVDVECEARAACGWKPLLPVMPFDAAERGWDVPWAPEELAMAQYWQARQAGQQQRQEQQAPLPLNYAMHSSASAEPSRQTLADLHAHAVL